MERVDKKSIFLIVCTHIALEVMVSSSLATSKLVVLDYIPELVIYNRYRRDTFLAEAGT